MKIGRFFYDYVGFDKFYSKWDVLFCLGEIVCKENIGFFV